MALLSGRWPARARFDTELPTISAEDPNNKARRENIVIGFPLASIIRCPEIGRKEKYYWLYDYAREQTAELSCPGANFRGNWQSAAVLRERLARRRQRGQTRTISAAMLPRDSFE